MGVKQLVMTHDALDNLDDAALVIGLDGSILDANLAALDCYGHSLVEMLGLSIHDLRAPGDQADIDAHMRRAAKNGVVFEGLHLRADGSTFPVEVRSVPVLLEATVALLSFVTDVTTREGTRRQLEESESRYRALAEGSPLAVFICRNEQDNDQVVLANPACLKLFGASESEELLGTSALELFDPDSRELAREHIRDVGETLPLFEAAIVRLDGTRADVEVTASALLDQGVAAIQVVLRDVTERTRALTELELKNAVLSTQQETSMDGILVVDEAARIISYNRRFVEMWSIPEALVEAGVDGPVLQHVASQLQDRQSFLDRVRDLYEHPEETSRDDLVLADGRVFERYSAPMRDPSERCLGRVWYFHDVTERKTDQERLASQLERIERTLTSVIDIATRMVEERDPYTAGHQRRVSELAVSIAEDLELPEADVESIRVAALVHDIGKVRVPAEILSKPGALSQTEMELIRVHPEAGFQIISAARVEQPVPELVYQHHERCDGSGYPRGLRGDRIAQGAKVIAVADVVEAMMSHRPYRPALGIEAALAEIERGAEHLYDADAVRSCVCLFREKGFEFSESP